MTLADKITIAYICFQASVTIFVSIAGAYYVRREFVKESERMAKGNSKRVQSHDRETAFLKIIQNISSDEEDDDDEDDDQFMDDFEEANNPKTQGYIPFEIQDESKSGPDELSLESKMKHEIKMMSKMNFFKLWLKICWKMRSVYACFMVHIFDVLTDCLVLFEWYYWEEKHGDLRHINPRIMAICGIAILLFHKLTSTLAIWMKEKEILRCVLQFMDLLILLEIYVCHNRILTQFQNQLKNTKTNHRNKQVVETTMSFKFIRNLEAIFESMITEAEINDNNNGDSDGDSDSEYISDSDGVVNNNGDTLQPVGMAKIPRRNYANSPYFA
eukprot:1055422_1